LQGFPSLPVLKQCASWIEVGLFVTIGGRLEACSSQSEWRIAEGSTGCCLPPEEGDTQGMRIQTFSILTGSEACNARCPFCISKMTPPLGVQLKEPEVNWRNFAIACRLAQQSGVTTVMLTGKGEPTLFPDQITRFLRALEPYGFPLVELQSNGIAFLERSAEYENHLHEWHALGLTTVALSVSHYLPGKNREIYLPHRDSYIDLPELIRLLHRCEFSVRLTCVMADGYIDNTEKLAAFIAFAKQHQVEQFTVRPLNHPKTSRNREVFDWTAQHHLKTGQLDEIRDFLQQHGHLLMTLVHGALVYDVDGQNVCLTDSLTIDSHSEDLRQLIFFPDGHLRYDWQYPGAILL